MAYQQSKRTRQSRPGHLSCLLAQTNSALPRGHGPFPTALIGDYPENPLALSFYGVVMALMAAAFVFMRLHMQKTECLHPDVDEAEFRSGTRLAVLFGPVAYVTGALASWLLAPLAFAVYLGIPIYFVLPHAVRARAN